MAGFRLLTAADAPAANELLGKQPELNVQMLSRTSSQTMLSMWGWFRGDELHAVAHASGNFTAVGDLAALPAFARELARTQPLVGSLVGSREWVLPLWAEVAADWPQPARLIRQRQPYLSLRQQMSASAERVRPATSLDLPGYLTAASQMFTAEVGIAPGGRAFADRITRWQEARRCYGWFDADGRTLFKLDVGAVAAGVAQVQGVWLAPALRGRGLAAGLIAEACALVQQDHAPTITLYVNDFNLPAIAAYQAVGFEQVGEYATVFF